ncbi:MAG: sigma-54 interaction domain-containing protein [Planctomycetota bacterium]|jgi:PAS domain S-box-containing protein
MRPTNGPAKELDTILDSIADGVFTVDLEWRIMSFNRAAEKITGVPRGEAIGRQCSAIFRSSICEAGCALKHTMETGEEIINRTVNIVTADGRAVPISVSTAVLKDDHERAVGGVETFRDLTAVEQLRKELEGRYTFQDILSRSHRMRELFGILPEMAASESTILIEGESGTGKELLARAVHSLSPRAEGPLVTVNCGALPDTLLESELFGHKAGAFTDAKKDKPGRFALAEGGTIFLDEVGDVTPAMQVRLLRVLQEKVYEPLGATGPVEANVRVVTATHRKLEDLVAEGRFRQDLYYRINVVRLSLPPLRDRKEDIPLLVDHFIARFNGLQGKAVSGISDEALACLMAHDFPGNVRELENIIEHAFVLCRGPVIDLQHLPEPFCSTARPISPASSSGGSTLEEMEKVFILAALKRHGWNRGNAAKELGIHRSTLRRKMKTLGIEASHEDDRGRE